MRSIKLKIFTKKHVPYLDNQKGNFLEIQYTTKSNENNINNSKKVYFKLPYIRAFSNATKI